MERDEAIPGRSVGAELRQARQERGIELREVEAETKIRIKYLRALEAGEWDTLPARAYTIGFLRTYADHLGLDAERLAHELRTQLDAAEPLEQRHRFGEPVVAGRERQAGPRPLLRLALLALVALALAAGVAWALGLFEADEASEPSSERANSAAESRRKDAVARSPQESKEPVELRLFLRDDVLVCLLGSEPRPLIDNQVLSAGSAEDFAGERFELRFPQGYERRQVRLELDGRPAPLAGSLEPAAYRMGGGPWLRPVTARGGDCP